MTEQRIRKAFYTKICTEEEKVLACITSVGYHLKNKNITIVSLFTYNGNHIRMGTSGADFHNSLFTNSLSTKRDDEIRKKMKKLMIENPSISSNEIKKKLNCDGNKLNQIYMSLKREIQREHKKLQ